VAEFYSRPLSPDAKAKLTDFLEVYLESLTVAEVDERAEVAKRKAIECLQTDIDILAFVTTTWTIITAFPIVNEMMAGKITSRDAAVRIVAIAELARKKDKSERPGGGKLE